MDPLVVQELESIRDAPLSVMTKASKMLEKLRVLGYIKQMVLKPSSLIVHAQNRAGLMVNPWNVHEKGYEALKVGWSLQKLQESFCMEISQNMLVKEKQLLAMQVLVEGSEGKLAMNGKEQYQSLSSSHMSQFCKAVGAGCYTSQEKLASICKILSLETLVQHFQDQEFAQAVTEGWCWNCIAGVVEQACPWFPNFLQGCLNASNHIAGRATEMELALHLAEHYKGAKNLDQALEACKGLSSLPYLNTVAQFVQHFAGGEDFPLIHFLLAIEKTFNTSMLLGQDFFTAIVKTDLGSKETTFPVVRSMLLAVNLSSNKHADGISKLLVKSDVEKLKQLQMRINLEAAEKLGLLLLEENKAGLLSKDMVKLLGRFWIRCGLWLCKKEGKGRESKTFGNLATIHLAYVQEKTSGGMAGNAGPAAGSAGTDAGKAAGGDAGTEKVMSLQAPGHEICIFHLNVWFYSLFKHLLFFCYSMASCGGHQQHGHDCSAEVQLAGAWEALHPGQGQQEDLQVCWDD